MQTLTPILLAEKIKQLLNGGVELEDIQKMALSQGVDPLLFSEALDIIQGKVTESMEIEPITKDHNISRKAIFISIATLLGGILLIFFIYILLSKFEEEPTTEPISEPAVKETPVKAIEVDETSSEALDFVEELESNFSVFEDDFYEDLTTDLNLSAVTVIEDLSSNGSQLVSEEGQEAELDDLVVDIEVGRYEIIGLPRTVKPGVAYDFQVEVYDTDDNILESYNQEIEFRSTARNIAIEPTYKFKPSDKGVATRTVTFNILGKHTLAVNAKGNTQNRAQVSVRIRK